ncbi:hypothetical protein EB796_004840 [Bugula neritina]|uniref:Uncharacterized protein n=1 Tax=Bugula neritina TaxID=10212 RepID=A0A7J7KG01_BUGNE|nr:hypothetical protein EB796_004840 [Bugula neritina]
MNDETLVWYKSSYSATMATYAKFLVCLIAVALLSNTVKCLPSQSFKSFLQKRYGGKAEDLIEMSSPQHKFIQMCREKFINSEKDSSLTEAERLEDLNGCLDFARLL